MKKSLYVRIIKLGIYTLCIALISVFSTLLIRNALNRNEPTETGGLAPGNVDPGKSLDLEYYEENFDQFVAFGGYLLDMFPADLLLKSNLISEEDKDKLVEYNSTYNKGRGFYNIYLGVKNGEDIVELHHLSKPYETLKFSSNLDYKFISIIHKFEEISGETLSKEFLQASDKYCLVGRENFGIVARFRRSEDDLYILYFTATISGKFYCVDEYDLI